MNRTILLAIVALSGCNFGSMRGAMMADTDTDADATESGTEDDAVADDDGTSSGVVDTTGPAEDESSSSGDGNADASGSDDDESSSSTGEDPLVPDLWHEWNGDLADTISGQSATKIGNPVLADDTVVLDGSSSGIELLHFGPAYRAALDSSTVAIRYYAESNAGYRALISLGGMGEDVATNACVLVIRDGSIELVTETGAGEDHVAVLGAAPSEQEWHDLVLVTDAGAASLYIDGDWIDTNPYVAAETESEILRLGVTGWTSSWWWGSFDDLRIWTRPLSEDEISAL